MRRALEHGGLDELPAILKAAVEAPGASSTLPLARGEADRALAALGGFPGSACRDALASLAEFAVQRRH